jgi:HdeA/HdeB family
LHAISKARNTAMKKLIAFYAIIGLLLLAEAAAEDRMERIDLAGFTCKQFLEMNRDDALIVVGWLQGYYLDEHTPPVVDFARLSVDSVSLANRCAARPDQKVLTTADRMFGR